MIGRVCGTGSYLPIRTVSNDELSHVMETSDEWIRERTGIRFRHVALEETTSDMAAEAAAMNVFVNTGLLTPDERTVTEARAEHLRATVVQSCAQTADAVFAALRGEG